MQGTRDALADARELLAEERAGEAAAAFEEAYLSDAPAGDALFGMAVAALLAGDETRFAEAMNLCPAPGEERWRLLGAFAHAVGRAPPEGAASDPLAAGLAALARGDRRGATEWLDAALPGLSAGGAAWAVATAMRAAAAPLDGAAEERTGRIARAAAWIDTPALARERERLEVERACGPQGAPARMLRLARRLARGRTGRAAALALLERLAARAAEAGDLGRAARWLREVVAADPNARGARFNLAVLACRTGDAREDDAWRDVQATGGTQDRARDAAIARRRARLAQARGDDAAARAQLAAALRADPRDSDARIDLADLEWEAGHDRAARDHFAQAIRWAGDDATRFDGLMGQAACDYRLGRVEDSLSTLEQAIALRPQAEEASSFYATIAIDSPDVCPCCKPQTMVTRLTRAIELAGDRNPRLRLRLGVALADTNQLDLARGHLEFAIDASPGGIGPLSEGALALARAGDHETAARWLARAKPLARTWRDHADLAAVAADLGDDRQAVALAARAVALDAGVEGTARAASALAVTGLIREAERIVRDGLRRHPREGRLRAGLGLLDMARLLEEDTDGEGAAILEEIDTDVEDLLGLARDALAGERPPRDVAPLVEAAARVALAGDGGREDGPGPADRAAP